MGIVIRCPYGSTGRQSNEYRDKNLIAKQRSGVNKRLKTDSTDSVIHAMTTTMPDTDIKT